MEDKSVVLSLKEEKRRDEILNHSLWKVLLVIFLPIAMYNYLTFLFGVFDLKIVSLFPTDPKDSLAFFDEIKNAISAFGVGFAAGGAVIVANLYGKGEIDEARKNAGVVLILTTLISLGIIILTVFGVIPILRSLNVDKNLIDEGIGYFYIQVLTTALTSINIVFIGLEKAKGNTKIIFILNIAIAVAKVVLTLLFVFVLNLRTLEWLAVTTLLSQLVMTIIAVYVMFNKKNIFRINFKDLGFNKKYIKQMFLISIPLIFGRFVFSFGKVIVNYFATVFYGSQALSALTITYKANFGIGNFANSIEEAETTIISQNVGNNSPKRGFEVVKIATVYTTIITLFGVLMIALFGDYSIKFFITHPGVNATLEQIAIYNNKIEMAKTLLKWESFSMLTTAFINVFLGGFYGFKLTRVSYVINIVRLFVFRIPVLLILYYLFPNLGYEAVGMTMMFSNLFTMILVIILFLIFYIKSKNCNYSNLIKVGV